MATIDLRHLVEPEHDVIQITGSVDRQEYTLPVKRTMGMVIMLNQYFSDYMKTVDDTTLEPVKNLELNYRMITAWMRGAYNDITLEWVKNNISDELFLQLVKLIEPLFFPEPETGKPKKTRKNSSRS